MLKCFPTFNTTHFGLKGTSWEMCYKNTVWSHNSHEIHSRNTCAKFRVAVFETVWAKGAGLNNWSVYVKKMICEKWLYGQLEYKQ